MFIFGKRPKLKPELGFWQLLLMAISGTLGGGLFVLIGQGAEMAGSLLPLTFLVAGSVAFLISRVYAELATSMPATGGGQVYIRNAFGNRPIFFIFYWLTWIAEVAFTALAALGLGFYLSPLIGISPVIISIGFIILLVLINLRGIGEVGKVEVVIGFALLVGLLVLLGLILKDFSWGNFSWQAGKSLFGVEFGWLMAVPLMFVVFMGNEDIAAIASEVKNKAKNIPKVLGLSVISLTILTVIFAFVITQSFPIKELANSSRPFGLFSNILGSFGGILSYFVVILACASSLFYGFLSDTRTAFALSEAGELPEFFSILNKRKVPQGSVFASGILIIILCLSQSASFVAYIANIGFFLECILVSSALLKLRKKRPHLPRPFLVKPYPLVPILVIIFSIVFIVLAPFQAWLAVVYFSALGFLIYLIKYVNKKRSLLALKGILWFLIIITILFLLLRIF